MEPTGPNAAQIEFWNGRTGAMWVERQAEQDATIQALGAGAMDAAQITPGERVLDVGCGCGDTTLAIAELVGPAGRVTGVDISSVMLGRAAQRAAAHPNIAFENVDAEQHDLPESHFDLAFSRFGVMFFGNPERAFARFNRALRPGGRLAFLCWQPRELNPFFAIPLRAARNHIELPPPVGPDEPGPFALADRRRVRRILESAGFAQVAFTPQEKKVRIAGTNDFTAAVAFLMRVGPMAAALADVSDDVRERIREDLAAILQPHYRGDGVYLRTRTWVVTARATDCRY